MQHYGQRYMLFLKQKQKKTNFSLKNKRNPTTHEERQVEAYLSPLAGLVDFQTLNRQVVFSIRYQFLI